MKIFLGDTGAVPEYSSVEAFAKLLAGQRPPVRHHQVDDPAISDVVLFTDCHMLPDDWKLGTIARNDAVVRYPHKAAVYNERDRPWCSLPGIYVSMPKTGFVPRWQVAGAYFAIDPPLTRPGLDLQDADPDLLFSFIGGRSHRCREAIFNLKVPRTYIERTDGFMFYDTSSDRFEERRKRFAEIMQRSSFVLCPRGHGTSSFRLYETLSAGRVPVIIADEWVPPDGPVWEEFAIRWPESRIAELPAHLEALEGAAGAMGALALAAYEQWFARDVVISHQLDQLEDLMGVNGFEGFPAHGVKNRQYLRIAAAERIGQAKKRYRHMAARHGS